MPGYLTYQEFQTPDSVQLEILEILDFRPRRNYSTPTIMGLPL